MLNCLFFKFNGEYIFFYKNLMEVKIKTYFIITDEKHFSNKNSLCINKYKILR